MVEQLETYGSAKLRVVFMDDERWDCIKTDTLFENLHDFWTSYRDSNKSIFKWYGQKNLGTWNDYQKKVEPKSFAVS